MRYKRKKKAGASHGLSFASCSLLGTLNQCFWRTRGSSLAAELNMALLAPDVALLLIALVLLAAWWLFSSPEKSSLRLPPGPPPLPVIGNLHMIDLKRQDLSFMKIAKEYGPVFTVYYGMQRTVVLTGYDAVKEALVSNGNAFIDRPDTPIFTQIQHWNGVLFSKGEPWKITRRYMLRSMRDFGMGKRGVEGRILEEMRYLFEMVDSFKGEPFKLRNFISAPTNITFAILFGNRFDYADPTFIALVNLVYDVVTLLGSPFLQLFNIYPRLGFLFKPHKTILSKMEEARVVLRKCLQDTKETFNENNLRNFIDAMVLKQREEGMETEKAQKWFHDENVLASVIDLALAGTETTSTTLQWGILLMMKHPEVQQKVQEEIRSVLGSERLPTFEDKIRMPYCYAVVHEVQRFCSLLQHLPRCTVVDTLFRGYVIPKGTTVIPSLTSVLYDKTQWETPEQFNPNHFLDADGNFVKKDAFLAFSIGRRVCVGESLARMELFLFFVGLLQKYTFHPPPGVAKEDLDLTATVAFTLRPQPYSTCAVPCK